MNEETTIAMGEYCESVMAEPSFQFLTRQYELGIFKEFTDSDPRHVKEREHLYAKLTGVKDFLNHMLGFVIAKDKLLEQQALSNSPDEDAPIDGID